MVLPLFPAADVNRRRAVVQFAALLCAGLLAGCADDPQPEAAAEVEAILSPARPVARVTRLEIGRARNGFVLAAVGVSEGAGWRSPRLEPVFDGPGPDGYLVFDFLAIPPNDMLAAPEPARTLRADALIAPDVLQRSLGVRVRGSGEAVEIAFD
jgi:hypothetical protein